MAAGKSTVAQGVAERFSQSAHVRGDQFRRSIVSGRHEMTSDPTDDALDQLRLRYRIALQVAEQYRQAGFVAVLQDTIVGPMLGEVIEMVEHRPFSLIVLAPEPTEVARREDGRAKTGYTSFAPEQLDDVLRADTPRRGYWLDSTALTVQQTVDAVIDNLDGPALIT